MTSLPPPVGAGGGGQERGTSGAIDSPAAGVRLRSSLAGLAVTTSIPNPSPFSRSSIIALATTAIVLLLGGILYFRIESERILREQYDTIRAVAEAKSAQIGQWRRERLSDASRLAHDPAIGRAVRALQRDPNDEAARAALRERLRPELADGTYHDVRLLARDGNPLFDLLRDDPAPGGDVPPVFDPVSEVRDAIAGALGDGEPRLSEFHRRADEETFIDAVAVVPGEHGERDAVVLLCTRAEAYLYPLIQTWPTPSRSAETLLVHRSGDEVVFLNDLRHREHAALALRLPLARTDVVAVQAVLGKTGRVSGKDYRDHAEVLADLRAIPGSPWFLVAKIDSKEVLAEARYRGGMISLLVLLCFMLAIALVAVVYRRRQAELFQDLYQSVRRQHEAEEEFRTTLYSIGDAVMTSDRAGLIRQMNPVAEELTGWTEDAARGQALDLIFRIVNEETRAEVESPVTKVLREQRVVGLANHTLLIARDGTERPIADSGAPILDDDGAMSGVVLVFRDQTDERAAERALRESELWHRVLFEKSRDALMTFEPPNWRFTSANDATVALFGARDEADLVSRGLWQYAPDKQPDGTRSQEKAIEMIERALRDGTCLFDFTHRRVNGEEFPAAVLLTRIDLEQKVVLQATVRDESETRNLQAIVAQADRLSSMGMLAAGVAHEINNPLAYVLFNVETLAQELPRLAAATARCCTALRDAVGDAAFTEIAGEDTALLEPSMLSDAADRAVEALGGTRRIQDITRGLGTFSRVERTERSKVDVHRAIESAINMAYNEIKFRARLVKDFGRIPAVLASEGKLSQIFLNLLINAAHAIDEGEVEKNRIVVRSWADEANVFVEVTDTGKGISAENQKRIFEPFFTTKGVGMGSGLGLAICKNLVSELGGEITIDSEPGRGTRFVVRLPVQTTPADEAPASPPAELAGHPPVRGRLLVIDDEEAIRKTLIRLLGRDHEVMAAASGKEAQAILESDANFDLIVCDLMMPQMTGMDLHAWLAGRNSRLAAQIVFMTGGAFTPKAHDYLSGTGNLKIEKPFSGANLRRLVGELVIAARSKP